MKAARAGIAFAIHIEARQSSLRPGGRPAVNVVHRNAYHRCQSLPLGRIMRRLGHLTLISVLSFFMFTPVPAAAGPAGQATDSNGTTRAAAPAAEPVRPESVAADQRDEILGSGWAKSADRAVATASDSAGFHVLVADAKDGYRWRTAASLSEPGFDTDTWIGNICVTAGGDRAVVVYAPRTFPNKAVLAERGGFTAIVDLAGGTVHKLAVQTSLAYYNPGCGPTDSAVLTQEGTEDRRATRLLRLDVATGKLAAPIDVPGQLTSAVPTSIGIVAADSGGLVRVEPSGRRTILSAAEGVPYRVTADADGGVVYVERQGRTAAAVQRVVLKASGRSMATTLATGDLTDVSVRSGRGGQVFVTGAKTSKARSTPASVKLADVPTGAAVSLSGGLAVTSVQRADGKDPRVAPADPTSPQLVDISAVSMGTGKAFTLSVAPSSGAGKGAEPSPALKSAQVGNLATAAAGSPTDPSDGSQRYCSVPRNDPHYQAMQPTPRQVEWAVDQAVRGVLTVSRPANWKNSGMPAYTPQGLFPPRALAGGGYVPAQVMLGIATQESNMWEAARFAVPGVTANPLIGNYFGLNIYDADHSDDWVIHWDEADCGYGVMQVTDGMRLAGKEKPGETALPWNSQLAIGLDFAANVAKGLQLLQDKWNETRAAGLVANNGAADRIENWYFAVWAYNSGFHANTGSPWGVGWLNNPVNPRYPADRHAFMDFYSDSAHPQDWPYPEKVMGFAGQPIDLIETPGNLVPAFKPAWWLTDNDRANVKTPVDLFCDSSNNCIPGGKFTPNAPDVIGEPAGPCAHKNAVGQYDLKCWYHQAATWKPDCASTCGHELLRFDPGYAYQPDATSYAPNCGLGGVPSNALVIDNLNRAIPSVRPNCSMSFTNSGSFSFDFLADVAGNYPGKIDVHQLGTGLAGQFWMSNTQTDTVRRARGTWTFNRNVPWGRVLVHLPMIGARTQQARYQIDVDGNGTFTKERYLNQEIQTNGWVSLGVYNFKGVPRIRLDNVTKDGLGTVRIAWDAMAIQPLPGKPKHIVAALGDSYSSGEGAGYYALNSDANHGTEFWNACRRSRDAYVRKLTLPGDIVDLGTLSDALDINHELGFVACSGATTLTASGNYQPPAVGPRSWTHPEDYEDGEGQFHEIAQTDSGVLDANTTLVTLTLGGNDEALFANAIKACIKPTTTCSADPFVPANKAIIDRTMGRLEPVLRKISTKAPNAKIVLLNYPKVLDGVSVCPVNAFNDAEGAAIAEIVGYLGAKEQTLADSLRAQGIKVYPADSIPSFNHHGACDDMNQINFIKTGPDGEGDFHPGDVPSPFCIPFTTTCISRESFHPNPGGTATYAGVLRNKLVEIGY